MVDYGTEGCSGRNDFGEPKAVAQITNVGEDVHLRTARMVVHVETSYPPDPKEYVRNASVGGLIAYSRWFTRMGHWDYN
jgi:hypothetical protein